MADTETDCISKKPQVKGLPVNYSAVYISIQHPSTVRGEFGKSLVWGVDNGQNSHRRSEDARRARLTRV